MTMATFQPALDALKKAASHAQTPKDANDAVDRVSSCLVLLKSSSPSLNSKNALASTLRTPFVPLYTVLPAQALDLSLALFLYISNDKITKLKPMDEDGRRSWETVQTAILSGILDYLEESENNESKEAVAATFYPAICTMFFPDPDLFSATTMGVSLRSMAYMVLYESAEHHSGNQRKLRDQNLLGGKRLGQILYQTNDFLAVETLFTVFARLLPSINSGDSGRAKRSKFVQAVFLQPSSKCGPELVQVLEEVSRSAWEDTVVVLMDVLARNYITFPQPFDLDEIRVCGVVFPQPTTSERLYLDNTCFFGNIIDDSDAYESLQVRYVDVVSIDLTPGPGVTQVLVKLSAPAIVAEAPMKPGDALTAIFNIKNEDIKRFLEALNKRGLRTSTQRKHAKISLPSLSLNLDHGRPPLSREDQIKDVRRAYGLDQSSDTSGLAEIVEEAVDSIKPLSTGLSRGLLGPILPHVPVPSISKKTEPAVPPFSRTATHITRDAVFGKQDKDFVNIDDQEQGAPVKHNFRAKARAFGSTDKGSSVTIAISPASEGRMVDLDDNMDEPTTLKTTKGRTSTKKKLVVDSETEDDTVEVPKNAVRVQDSLRSGPRTRVSTALANHLEIVAAAAINKSVLPVDDQTTIKKQPSRTAPKKKQAVSTSKRRTSLPTEVTLPVSDNFHLLPVAQSFQVAQTDVPFKQATPCASQAVSPGLYVSDNMVQEVVSDLADKSDAQIGLPHHSRITARGRAAGMKTRNDAPEDGSTSAMKRKKSVGPGRPTGAGEDRPVKRQRAREVFAKPAFQPDIVPNKSATSARTAKHYGKKGRTSSPVPSPLTGIDYDDLPASMIPDDLVKSSPVQRRRPTRKVSIGASKSRAAVTRRKDGKLADKAENKTTKTRAKRTLDTDDIKIAINEALGPLENKRVTRSKMKGKEEPPKDNNRFDTGDVVMDVVAEEDTANRANVKKAKKAPWEAPRFMDATTEVSLVQLQVIDKEPAKLDDHEHVEYVLMDHSDVEVAEHLVPTKNDSFPANVPRSSTPHADAVMFDLTLEVSPPKTAKKFYVPEPDSKSVESIAPLEHATSTPPIRPRHSVTFAPIIVTRPPSPHAYNRGHLTLGSPAAATSAEGTTRSNFGRKGSSDSDNHLIPHENHKGKRHTEGQLQDIVDALNKIQHEIIRNISNKFEGVKKDVRIGRDRILSDAASDLDEMRGDSVRHFNSLVDLEKDYATYSRRNTQSWADVKKINQEICHCIRYAIEDHDRSSLSKKFPNLLFSGPIPASLLKLKK